MTNFADWTKYQGWRDRFADVIDPRFYSIGWLDAEVWSGRARFWRNDDAAIVATLRVYPAGGREVHGLVSAGDLAGIVALIPIAETWGRELGCCVAGISSREGWTRVLSTVGYQVHQVDLRKEL